MYSEELRMSGKRTALLALPFTAPVAILLALLVLLPLPLAGRLIIGGALLLEAAVGVLLLASLSRIRIAIDDRAVTVAFRLLFTKRIALQRIVSCAPTDARVWGMAYRYRGGNYRPLASGGRAVLLTLTNGAQVVFPSRQAEAVCAALRARRPEIVHAAAQGSLSTEANKALVRRLIEEAWNQNRLADLADYVAEEGVLYAPGHGAAAVAWGPAPLKAAIADWRTAFPDFRYALTDLIAEGEKVAAQLIFTGTHQGVFRFGGRTLPPTGQALREAEIIIARIAGGKIVETWATWDRLGVLEQLGAAPGPDQAGG